MTPASWYVDKSEHHVPDEELVAYAAGTASDGASLAFACHISLCSLCLRRVAELEVLGGAILETTAPAELPQDSLARTLARIDTLSRLKPPTPMQARIGIRSLVSDLPKCLQAVVATRVQPPRWRFVLPGVRAVDLEWGSASETVRLIAFKGGISIPMHDHGGPEYVVVFSGVLEEEGSSFKRGDISIREPGQRHEQHVARGETCVALVVSQGKLRPLTLRGRILLALAFE